MSVTICRLFANLLKFSICFVLRRIKQVIGEDIHFNDYFGTYQYVCISCIDLFMSFGKHFFIGPNAFSQILFSANEVSALFSYFYFFLLFKISSY